MIEKVTNSALTKARKFSLNKRQKNNPMHNMNLPARKELKADIYEGKNRGVVMDKQCPAGEYEHIDYCSPLFP